MDAFSLLNYWNGGLSSSTSLFMPQSSSSTIITSLSDTADDDGPFFDLEFAVTEEDDDADGTHEVSDEDEDEEEELSAGGGGDADGEGVRGDSVGVDSGGEIKFTLSSCSGGDDERVADPNLDFSHSDDMFFKGRLVAVEPPSSSTKASAAQLSASLLKSATKFRVFMLGLKKSKSNHAKHEKSEVNSGSGDGDGDKQQSPPPPPPPPQQKSTFTVKLKVEEVPIISLFTRDNSSRNSSSSTSSSSSASSAKKQNNNESAASDDKRFVMMQKYLKKVKPLYVRVSRRYGEKLKFSGHLSFGSGNQTRNTAERTEAPTKIRKPPGSINIKIPAGLKVVKKHLGKSKSSSSATTSTATTTEIAAEKSGRRDDSLLQQQDGIQSAILHCKRSFNSSRDEESSMLQRSVSDDDPLGYEK